MNFSIHIDPATAARLAKLVAKKGRTRNAVIREAIRAWVDKEERRTWPEIVMRFQGLPTLRPFESYRKELLPPRDRPLE